VKTSEKVELRTDSPDISIFPWHFHCYHLDSWWVSFDHIMIYRRFPGIFMRRKVSDFLVVPDFMQIPNFMHDCMFSEITATVINVCGQWLAKLEIDKSWRFGHSHLWSGLGNHRKWTIDCNYR
jgi:hypothetical protein